MTKISKILFFTCVWGAFAQPPPRASTPVGFVNAVGVTSRTDLRIDGQSLKPSGFAEGGYASGIGIGAGNHQLSFSNPSCEKFAATVQVNDGISQLVVLYNVPTRQTDGTNCNVLKTAIIPQQQTSRGKHFFCFSTIEGRAITLQINGSGITVQPLTLTALAGESLDLSTAGIRPLHVAPREGGNYVLILFPGSDGTIKWSFVEMPQ